MGLYDREYYREEDQSRFPGGDRPVVVTLILINVAVFVLDFFSKGPQGEGRLTELLALRSDLLTHPWNAWQLLTAGFVHSTSNIWHIVFNMLFLWMFGREVEDLYGRREFLRLYLALIVLSSLTWVLFDNLMSGFSQPFGPQQMIGASGAVTGIMVIFACHFPMRIVNIWGVLPVPAWALVTVCVLLDAVGATTARIGATTAYAAHLGGAGFGYLYYRSGVRLGQLFGGKSLIAWFQRRPKLRLHRAEDDDDLSNRVDRVLEKISKEGEASLTRSERRLLESASRRYQQRRR